MIFFKKSKIKKGFLFETKTLKDPLKFYGVSVRHINEYFKEKEYMTWVEIDDILKRLGYRHIIVKVIGLPPELRKEQEEKEKLAEIERLKEEEEKERRKEQRRKEQLNMADYLKNVPSEVSKANATLDEDRKKMIEERDKARRAKSEKAKLKKRADERALREAQERKKLLSDDDNDWLKSIPSEKDKAKKFSTEVERDVNISEEFKKREK